MTLGLWKNLLLTSYLLSTSPCRTITRRVMASCGRAPIIVLFYHRVHEDCSNAWTIAPSIFAWQLDWLRSRFDLVSLEEAQQRIRAGTNRRPCVSITFDDGYADNCDYALPLLRQHRIPCTYFVTSQNVLTGTPFPHDIALGKPVQPNTVEQLRELVADGIEIGAHTRTHADLGPITDVGRLQDEVVQARKELEAAVGCRIRYFAFPFGLLPNLNPTAFWIAREAGYEAVCSAYGSYNLPGDDSFHLQRIHADADCLRFCNWLTLDPRKLLQSRRYEYGGEQAAEAPRGAALL